MQVSGRKPDEKYYIANMNASFAIDAIPVNDKTEGSIQVNYSGNDGSTPRIRLNASIDNVNYVPIDHENDVPYLSDASGTLLWDIQKLRTKYIKMVYDKGNATTGTIEILTQLNGFDDG